MPAYSIALLIYGDKFSGRDALTEEKYKDLAGAFLSAGCTVASELYNDELSETLTESLLKYDAVLVWVNPIEQGNDRKKLDILLKGIADKGCIVSAHPGVILKMGTKDILFKTRDMSWGSSTIMYENYREFEEQFPSILRSSLTRVLKQYRGNGGDGVYKVSLKSDGYVGLTHAKKGGEEKLIPFTELFEIFKPYFSKDGLLIDQEWNEHCENGMVRCYVSGTEVSGFGYQEINALYELGDRETKTYYPPSKRFYLTENCGLFSELKKTMENKWIPELQNRLSITSPEMPVIWDADFFIDDVDENEGIRKYTLCEINVSSVSPFPPSSIPYIVRNVIDRIISERERERESM